MYANDLLIYVSRSLASEQDARDENELTMFDAKLDMAWYGHHNSMADDRERENKATKLVSIRSES